MPSRSRRPASPRRSSNDDAVYDAPGRQYDKFQQMDRTFELVAKAVSPTVVHIVAQKTVKAEEGRRAAAIRGDRLRGHRPKRSRAGALHLDESSRRRERQAGEDPDLPAATAVRCCPAKVWSDEKADIAVMKLDRDDLPAARMGNSDEAPVGSWVMALGSPFGLTHSVSQGIISARGRHMEELRGRREPGFPPDRRGDQPGQLGRAAGEHEGRGDRHQQLDRLQRRGQ